jgi:hypothetical protein
MARNAKDQSVLEAAMRGAASGFIGGAALLAACKLEERGLISPRDSRGPEWDRRIRGVARKRGIRLSRRGVTLAEVGGYLVYSALLGALFGIAGSRLPLTGAARSLLESSFVYAASVPISGAVPQRRRKRKVSPRSVRKPRLPVDAGDVGLAATRVFDRFAMA